MGRNKMKVRLIQERGEKEKGPREKTGGKTKSFQNDTVQKKRGEKMDECRLKPWVGKREEEDVMLD